MLDPVRAIASLPLTVARTTASTVASAAEAAIGGGLEQARKVLGTSARPRRVWSTRGRTHIELRRVDPDRFEALAARLRERLGNQRGVRWVEALGAVGHVVVAFDEDATSPEELVEAVRDVEREQGLDQEPFEVEAPDHPGDVAPILRGVAELSGDALGVTLSVVGRLTAIRALPAPVDPGLITSLLAWTPRLRRPIEERLGTTATGVVLALANGVSQGLAGSVLGPTLDMAHRSVLLNEAIARRRLWHELEPRLWAEPPGHSSLPPAIGERPEPVPPGPLERYAEAMWRGSLGAFAVSLAATRSLPRATAAVYAGLPKAARMGREAFAAQVGRVFAGRGVLTLNPPALQLLDRVDCLVVHEQLLVEAGFELGELLVVAGGDAEQARRRAWSLFDAERPDRVRRNRGWTLGPVEALGLEPPPGQRRAAARLRRRARVVLGLAHNDQLAALVAIQPSLRPGAEELVAAARRAGLEVAIAGARDEAAPLEAKRVPAGGPGLTRAVRRLQRDGRVVALVASGEAPALPAADLSLGLRTPDGPPPLGAHVLAADDDLAPAFLLVQACAAGRRASQQSVRVAMAGAGVGGALTLTGPPATATRRVMTAVNVASTLSLGNGVRLATDLALQPPPLVRDRTPWHAMEVEAVLERLGSAPGGLDEEEARRRRQAPERPPSAPVLLGRSVLGEVVTPLTPILGAGAGLSAAFGSLTDAVMVSSVVGFNALLGGVQQFRADRAIADLGGRNRARVQVVRVGAKRNVGPDELVPGDVVVLQAGELVPADCRIMEAVALEADESSLTGESLPVAKTSAPSLAATVAERSSMLYEGSSVAAGQATAVVVATGPRTEARMGALLAATPTATSGVESRLSGLTSLSSPVAVGSGLAVSPAWARCAGCRCARWPGRV
jgi:cation-transporting P-type ATPase I